MWSSKLGSATHYLHGLSLPVRARLVLAQTLQIVARMDKAILCVAVLALLCTGTVICSISAWYQRLIVQECRTCKQQQMGTVGDVESAFPSGPAMAH